MTSRGTFLLLALAAIGILTLSVNADEWTEQYESLFGYMNRISVLEVKRTLNKLKFELDNSNALAEAKNLVDHWVKVAGGPLTKTECSKEYANALENLHRSSRGLRSFLKATRKKLTHYCLMMLDKFRHGLINWHDKKAVHAYTDWIKYDEQLLPEFMSDRLVKIMSLDSYRLRSEVFDPKASREENYQKFKEYYDRVSPCKEKPLIDFLREYPNLVDLFRFSLIYTNLDYDDYEIMRRVITCAKLNDLDEATRLAFDKLYAKVE